MKVINFDETPSVVSQYMAELRDVNMQRDMMRFRRNLERIGEIMAYEISKTLMYAKKDVATPLGTAKCDIIRYQNSTRHDISRGSTLSSGFSFIL